MPRVSVIIPTFNRKDLLKETLSSVLNQTFKDYEIIVVDHGSTDGTGALVQKEFGTVVRYLRVENCPIISCPRNKGIQMAKGDILAFLDSDDLWLPDKLEKQIHGMDKNPDYGWSYGNAIRFGPGIPKKTPEIGLWQLKKEWIFNDLIQGNFIPGCTVVAKKEALKKVGDFDESPPLRASEDYELWMRLAKKFPVYAVPDTLAQYRVSLGQVTNDSSDKLDSELFALKTIKEKVGIPEKAYKKARAAVFLRHFRYAVMAESPKAASFLKSSFSIYRWRIRTWIYMLFWGIFEAAGVSVLIWLEKKIKKITT